ncbi:Prophage tail length tape measure protein [Bradyrhizobium yuanmingense]|uniref:Prophage tail length tape measure protein n=1 Tax=Bradyrhizobium yuanmingense TaxID=108015 RepID=A0A1C3W7D7_9BRAD|nr:phage tail length tape measure family protein [Bradyrhizobium yuanmingense]TWI27382.1 tail length tape measure protein [Bradyrhizobium yuanmingense]SCB35999.1 Prophage tail length tape measure protein [Bradyrhizobium yuanmingense]
MADNEQLILSISADTRAMQRQLDKLVGQIGAVDNSLGTAFTKAPKKIDDVTKSLSGAKFQTANLAAQFQDIAVQLQGGQSPFTVALQQGTQISQVLGQGGAAGAVGLLGSAFASLLTPTSLATIATIALGGAAVQYVSKALGGVGDLDDKLKAHAELIKSLKDAYGEAGKGVDTAVKEAAAVLKTLLGFKTDDIKKEFQSLSASISKSLSDFRITGLGPAIEENSRKFAAFSDEITAFKTSVKNGMPDVLAFRRAIQEIADSTSDEKTRDLAKELLDLTSKAGTAQLAIEGTSRALRNFDATALAAAQQGEAFADAMKKLAGTVTPNLDDRQKIMQNYVAALEKAGSTEERLAVARARDDQLSILSTNERKKAAEDAASAQEQALKSFQNQINSQAKQDAKSLGRASGFGAGIEELTRLETQYKLTEAAQQAFGKVTPEVAAEIDKVAAAAGNAAAELAKARVVANTEFAAKTAFLTPQDLAIAQQLSGIYGNNVPAALQSAEAAALRSAYALRQIGEIGQDITRGIFTDFTQQIRNGASAMEALKSAGLNALSKIADKLASMAAEQLWSSAFGGSGGFNIGSLFGVGGASAGPITLGGPAGPVPFYASGTNFAQGGMAVVGEEGPELVNLPRGSQVIPNDALRAGVGGNISAPMTISIDARGADREGLARVQAQLAQLEAELPGRVVATVKRAKTGRVL